MKLVLERFKYASGSRIFGIAYYVKARNSLNNEQFKRITGPMTYYQAIDLLNKVMVKIRED